MLELIDIVNKRTKKELNKRKREAKKKKEKETSDNLMRFFFHDGNLTNQERDEAFQFFIAQIEDAIRPSIRTVLNRQEIENADALAILLEDGQENILDNYRTLISTILRGNVPPSNNNNEDTSNRRRRGQ